MSLIIPANSAAASGGYAVANSARFQTASLKRSAGSKTNATKATISMWFKRSELVDCVLMQSYTDDSNRAYIKLLGNTFYFFDRSGGTTRNYWVSTFVLRDVSAFYHLHINIDTGNGTAANRFIVHLNGVNQPVANFTNNATYGSGVTSNWQQASGTNQFTIGANESVNDQYFGGYMSEVVYLDGQVVAYDSFGEFDEVSNIWKPIDGLADLTVGNTGFYLDLEDSSDLGADVIGSNDFTAAGLAAIDQSTDTCTNNFCTWNSLDSFYSSATFSEGNTTVVTPNASLTYATATVGLSSGRWYFEVQPFDPSDNNNIGIVDHVSTSNSSDAGELQFQPRGWSYRQVGNVYNNNSSVSGSWDSYSAGVTIGVFVDLEDNKIYWSRNGVMQNSGTGVTITAAASTDTGFYFPAVGDYVTNDDTTFRTNFGGVSSFAISSGVTDDNGYGTFEYTPSVTVDSTAKKFYAICTKNLAEYG